MRVLMFCSQFYPIVGGAERQAELLARTLLTQGCHVEVATVLRDPTHPASEDIRGLRIHRFSLTDLTARLSGVRGLGVPNLLFQRLQIRRALRPLLPDFDILHTHIASPLVAFAQEEAAEQGRPAICKIACGGRGFDFIATRKGSLLGRRIEQRLIARMDRWVAISREVYRDLIEAGVAEERVVMIPNGIDISMAPCPRAQQPARRFLCIGRLVKFDFESLFGAFEDLLAEVPEVELRIAGRGDTEGIGRKLTAYPRLRNRATVVGFSPAAQELAWADALVHPSRAEGMSNILLEAAASGLPCAASDIEPNREVLAEGAAGLLFPLDDRLALFDVLRRLSQESGLGSRLITAAKSQIQEHYEIGVVAKRYQELYCALAG